MQLSRKIPVDSELHRKLVARIGSRMKIAESEQAKHHTRWKDAEERVLAYLPENEADGRRRRRREAGEPQYTTIQLPYTFAVLMTFHTYLTSVFFGRSPVHQFSGRHGEGEMQVQAMEALIAYQVDLGFMLAPYYLWMYDGGKYGAGWLGDYWAQESTQYATLEDEEDPLTGETKKIQRSQIVQGYKGNKVYNISPFDAFPDPRVTVGRFQDGEFFGVRQRPSWHTIKEKEARGEYMNVDRIVTQKGSAWTAEGSGMLERPRIDWTLQTDGENAHPAFVEVREVYVKINPKEWGLGESGGSELWVFTITEDLSTLIGVQPLGCMHGKFPVDVLEPEIEAYGIYNRSIPEILQPIQQTMDWLINTHFYNVRASLNNQFIIDPTKIVMKDVEKGGPGFVFRMRPEAFGQDIDKMFRQVSVQDVTQAHMGDLTQMFGIGERIFGINDQMLGMLAAGGRKTATEIRTSTGFGVNRLKTNSEYVSATAFSPHAQKLVMNSQQYYDGARKFRIVGDLALLAGQKFIMVTPDDIAGAFDFVPVDGTLPVDRFAQVTMWREMLGQIAQVPQIMMQYDLGKIFAWVAQLGGIKNVNQFKIQVVPDAQLASQAQQGNVIPLPIGQSGNAAGAGTVTRPPQPPILPTAGAENGAY